MDNIIAQILKKIVDKTNKKEINWKQSIKSNCYEFSTSNMTVKLEKGERDDPLALETTIFSFIDNKGEIFERVDALDYFISYEQVDNFFYKVAKQVNKVDEKLDTLLNELDDTSSSM